MRIRWMSLALFLFFSNGVIFNECLLLWEKPATLISDLDDQYELAVVLGGTTDVDRKPDDRLFFRKGADRVTHALNLYHEGKVKKILFTGGNPRLFENPNRDNVPIFDFYVMCGVKPEDIMIENSSRNTRENAFFVKKMLRNDPANRKMILITSAFHMRRAEGCFRKVGIDVTGFSTDFYSAIPKDRFTFHAFLPSPSVLANWNFLIKEWIGYLAYQMAGYI
ncbi:MAG: YdcF family protein [Cytophagales bacterium]|nr:YdcF family protein [Cytophagales bacterium]